MARNATINALPPMGASRLGGRQYWSLKQELDGIDAFDTGGSSVRIAILDGAIDRTHSCFSHSVLQPGYSIARASGSDASIEHGTAVASLVIGRDATQGGGFAPRATVLPIAIFAGDGHVGVRPCSQDDLAIALQTALEARADVINISGGGFDPVGRPDPALTRTLEACASAGVAVIAAAGNDGCACPHVPAASPTVLAVGALAENGAPLTSSNWGRAYLGHGMMAPGERLPVARAFGGWTETSGTSYAAALMSGLVARLLSAARRLRPDLRGVDVVQALLSTACPPFEAPQSDRRLGGSPAPRAAFEWLRKAEPDRAARVRTSPAPRAASGIPVALSGLASAPDKFIYAIGQLSLALTDPSIPIGVALRRSPPSSATRAADLEPPLPDDGAVWSLNSGGRPILILRPEGAFARENYAWLTAQIARQWSGQASRVALAGLMVGRDAETGVPILRPERLGLASWPRRAQDLTRLARDTGRSGGDRALNFALTCLAQPAGTEALLPASAEVHPAALGRPNLHETVVAFFDPAHRLSAGRKIWRATVDVSEVLPFFVDGPHEYWTA